MNLHTSRILLAIRKSPQIQIVIYVTILLMMGNLNALVDVVLHPEFSYFDGDHLIVGGVTTCASGALIGLLNAPYPFSESSPEQDPNAGEPSSHMF